MLLILGGCDVLGVSWPQLEHCERSTLVCHWSVAVVCPCTFCSPSSLCEACSTTTMLSPLPRRPYVVIRDVAKRLHLQPSPSTLRPLDPLDLQSPSPQALMGVYRLSHLRRLATAVVAFGGAPPRRQLVNNETPAEAAQSDAVGRLVEDIPMSCALIWAYNRPWDARAPAVADVQVPDAGVGVDVGAVGEDREGQAEEEGDGEAERVVEGERSEEGEQEGVDQVEGSTRASSGTASNTRDAVNHSRWPGSLQSWRVLAGAMLAMLSSCSSSSGSSRRVGLSGWTLPAGYSRPRTSSSEQSSDRRWRAGHSFMPPWL